jgi:CheY-like chemotaxis protein
LLIGQRGHQFTVSIPREPIRVEVDPTRLEQVIDNLLTNAAKYSDPGGRIVLTASREGSDAVLTCRDSGIGIAPDQLPHIFDLFVQAERRLDRSQGGLGIGLSLVRSLVEMHGGTVTATSGGLGLGSEFVVRLPAVPNPVEPEPAGRAEGRDSLDSGIPRRRILVVDDNVDSARSMSLLLKRLWGQMVEVAHDGEEALVKFETFRPDVILLDIGLPGMDGIEVATHLRERPEFATALIVALSGWGHETDFEKTRAAGFDHHLVKPAQPAHILKLLSKVDKTAKTVSERGPIALDSSRASS